MKVLRLATAFASLIALSSVLFARSALAVDFALAVGQTHENLSISPGDRIRLQTYDDRSYCCSTNSSATDQGVGFSSVTNLTAAGLASVQSGLISQNGFIDRGGRTCHFQDDVVGQLILFYNFTNFTPTPPSSSIRCVETTLVGGFNTSVTDFNFLEMSIQALDTFLPDLKGKVIITTVVNPQTVEIPFTFDFSGGPEPRLDISIHDAIGNVNDFGQITIIHNGPADMVSAKLTQYRIVTAVPLNFEPVLQEVFVRRAERW